MNTYYIKVNYLYLKFAKQIYNTILKNKQIVTNTMGLNLDKCCGANNTINIINNKEYINVTYSGRVNRPSQMGKKIGGTMYDENFN